MSTTTQVLLASARVAMRDQLQAVLDEVDGVELVQVVDTAEDIVPAIDRLGDVDVVLIDEVVGHRDGLEVVREVGFARPLCAIVLMSQNPTPSVLAAAMDAGARSIVAAPPSLEDVRSRIESAATWSRSVRRHVTAEAAPQGDSGHVVAFAGSKGGVGTTVLAMLTARALAARGTVCLVDLDLQCGDIAAYAGVTVRRSIADLVDVADEISGRALGETTYDIGHGLRLLGAPAEGEVGEEVTARATRQILTALRYQFDLVVVDCGSRLDDATAVALEMADRALIVTTPDVPAMRGARRTVALWERLEVRPPSTVGLVVNRVAKRAEVQPALAPKLSGLSVTASVPLAGPTLESAMNTASMLGTPVPGLDKAVDRLAASVSRPTMQDAARVDEPAPQPVSRRSRRTRSDAGQMAVETPFIIGTVVLLTLVAVQMILFGVSHLFAGRAAAEAARAYAVGMSEQQVREVVQEALPGGWDTGWTVTRPDPRTARVGVHTPSIVPSLLPLAHGRAAILEEP